MPQLVDIPGKGLVEFPDDMSEQDMSAAIYKNFPELDPEFGFKEPDATEERPLTQEESQTLVSPPKPRGNFLQRMGTSAGEVLSDFPLGTPGRFIDALGGTVGVDLTKPIVEVGKPVSEMVQKVVEGESPIVAFSELGGRSPGPLSKDASPLQKMAVGATQAAGDLADFFTSPLGITMLATSKLPPTAQRGVAGAFAADMIHATPDIAAELSVELAKPKPDVQKLTRLAVGAGANTFLAGMLAGKAVAPNVRGVGAIPPNELAKLRQEQAAIAPESRIAPLEPAREAQAVETAQVVQEGIQSGLARASTEVARVAVEPVPTVKPTATAEGSIEIPKGGEPVETQVQKPKEAQGVLTEAKEQPAPTAETVPVSAPPIEQGRVVPEAKEGEVSVNLGKIGDAITIRGVDSILAQSETHGGVRYDLFNGAKLKEQRAAVRVVDVDSGEVVTIKQYPTYDAAESAFNEAIRVSKPSEAAPLAEPPKAETGDIPADLAKEIEAQKTGSGPLTTAEKVELNELEQIKADRGKLAMLNQARLDWLKSRATAAPEGGASFSPEALQTEPGATLGFTPSGLSVPATTIDNLVKKVRQQLSVSGKMPREVHELQTQMESSMRAADFDLRMAERDFMREVSQTYGLGPVGRLGGGTRRIPPADVQLMDEYLHGRLTPDQANRIPQNIRGQLDNMRAGIEGWSNKTIATLEEQLSRLDPESAKAKMLNDRIETIRSNMDVYVHRSYKFFDKNTPAPDWYAKLPAKVRVDAEAYVRDNMNLTPAEAQSNLLRWLSDLRDESSFRQGGRVGSKDLTMFLQRKAIPQELRAVLGEYRSPLVNYAKSVSKMSQFVAKQKFLDEVRRKGMGSFLFEEGTEPPGFNARIAPEGSESMSPLSGLRTSQDIADAFKDLDRPIGTGNTVWDGAVRGYLTLNAWTKFANTAQSLMTHSRNIISRVPMAIQAGHWNILHVPQAMKLIYQDFAGSNKTWRPFLNRLYKLGVIGDTSRSTELRNILKDAAFQDVAPAELSSWSLMRALKTGLVKIPGDIYRLTDELGNIYGFLNERAIQKRIHPDWTEAKLDAEAATVIRDLYPTYSEAPKIVQTFRKNILVGPFVNFPYQVFRNAVNGVVRSAREIQSENPVERQVGWKRLGSQLLAASTPFAMMELSKQMLGITAQEEDDLRRFLPAYDKNSTLIFTGRDPKTGELSYINASRLVPSTYITDIANPVIREARSGGNVVKGVVDGIKEAFRPFYNEQMLLKASREAYNGVTDTGRKLFNKTDSEWTQTTKRIGHVITALEPGTLQRAQKRIIPALRDEQPRFGRKLEPMREIAREVTGIATEKFNFKTALGFKVRSFVDMSNEAEDHFRRIATGTSKVSEQDVIDAYRESDRRRIAVWQEMRDDYLAAIRRGVSVNEGKSIMRARGMSKADAESIANGRYKPMEVSEQVRKRAKEIGRALPYNATFRESVRTPSKP